MGRLRDPAEPEDREPPVAAQEADLEPRLIDQARLFSFSAEEELIRRASADPLVRALAVEPLGVARQVPVDRLEGAITAVQ